MFLVPFLTLMREDAPQREYSRRDLFNAMRYVVKTRCQWRYLSHDLPPWTAVYQQAQRWVQAGVFESITHELRVIVRIIEDREPHGTLLRVAHVDHSGEGTVGASRHDMLNEVVENNRHHHARVSCERHRCQHQAGAIVVHP